MNTSLVMMITMMMMMIIIIVGSFFSEAALMIQPTECWDNTCQSRCVKKPPFPNNFCHIERWGTRSQQAECAPAQPPDALCVQETIYQYFDSVGTNHHKNTNNKNNNEQSTILPPPSVLSGTKDDEIVSCNPDRAYSTEPRQCGVCLRNRVHEGLVRDRRSSMISKMMRFEKENDHEDPPQFFEYVMYTNCSSPSGDITLLTQCDPQCQNCTGTPQQIPLKKCLPRAEFGISVTYSLPFRCGEQLIVSTFNSSVQNCTGGVPEKVSHTITKSCYTEHPGRSVSFECINV